MTLSSFNTSDVKLLLNLFKIGLKDRFLGSTLGLIWAIANPVLMLGIFTFVFGFVFKSKLPGAETSLSYVIWLISGYGPWLAIAEGISTGTVAVTGNSGLVKNLAFKTELLPLSQSLLGLVPFFVTIIYLFILMICNGSTLQPSIVFMIPLLLCQIIFVAGISLFLSCMNVFIRDVSLALPNLLLIVLFASPIFYPINSFPTIVQKVLSFNPIYILTAGYRQIIFNESVVSWPYFVYFAIFSVLIFVAGLKFFRKFKTYFDSRI